MQNLTLIRALFFARGSLLHVLRWVRGRGAGWLWGRLAVRFIVLILPRALRARVPRWRTVTVPRRDRVPRVCIFN